MRGGANEKGNRNSGNGDHSRRDRPKRAGRGAPDWFRSRAGIRSGGRRDRSGRRRSIRAVLLWTGLRLLRSGLWLLRAGVLPRTLCLLRWTVLPSPLLASSLLVTNVAD